MSLAQWVTELSSSAVENATQKVRRMKLHDLTWQFAMKEFFKLCKINFFVIRKVIYHLFAHQMLSGFSFAMYKVLKLIWETARILIIRRGENYLMKGYRIGNKNLRLSPPFFVWSGTWVLGATPTSGSTPHELVSQSVPHSQEANSSKRQTYSGNVMASLFMKHTGAQSCMQVPCWADCPTYAGNKVVSKFLSKCVLYTWAKATVGTEVIWVLRLLGLMGYML